MVPENKAIQSVKSSFPDYSRAIQRAFAATGSFRSVCEDYHACSEALRHWENVASDEGAVRREEYSELIEELKREILCWLEALESLSERREGKVSDTDRR